MTMFAEDSQHSISELQSAKLSILTHPDISIISVSTVIEASATDQTLSSFLSSYSRSVSNPIA